MSWRAVLVIAGLVFLGTALPVRAIEPIAQLLPDDWPDGGLGFGSNIAMDGDVIVVGSSGDNWPEHPAGNVFGAGAVYIFRRTGGIWTQEVKRYVDSPLANEHFGANVAIKGDFLLAAAVGDPLDFPQPGVVYFFRHVGGTWVQEGILTPSITLEGDGFGLIISMDGDRAVIASPGSGKGTPIGRAFVFRWDGAAWVEEGMLTDPTGTADDAFASSVAISGTTVVVGVPWDDEPLNDSGSGFVFSFDGENWNLEAKLTPAVPTNSARFGSAIAVHDGIVLVGAPVYRFGPGMFDSGSVFEFKLVEGAWTEGVRIDESDFGGSFGAGLAFDGGVVVIGAPSPSGAPDFVGSGEVLDRIGGDWVYRAPLQSPNPADDNNFGQVIAMSGPWVVVSKWPVSVFCVAADAPCIPTLGGWGLLFLGVGVLWIGRNILRRRPSLGAVSAHGRAYLHRHARRFGFRPRCAHPPGASLFASFVLFIAGPSSTVSGSVVDVQLVPDRPGPYVAGSFVTVNVWLNSNAAFDLDVRGIQFDFRNSDSALILPTIVTFDYSSIENDSGYSERHPELPVPWTYNTLACICPWLVLQLPAGQSLRIGWVTLQLPEQLGIYTLDVLNAGFTPPEFSMGGGLHEWLGGRLEASTGELGGGTMSLTVGTLVPAISAWGTCAFGLLLLIAGTVVGRSRRDAFPQYIAPKDAKSDVFTNAGLGSGSILSGSRLALFLCVSWSCPVTALFAQEGSDPGEIVSVEYDSGTLSATGSGSEPVLLWSTEIELYGRAWMQIRFHDLVLSGTPETANESFVRLTAAEGGIQQLNGAQATQWGFASAFFNGDAVLVELFARPGTGTNRVHITEVLAAHSVGIGESGASICGLTDDRASSSDSRVGRIWPAGCSTFLFDDRDTCFLTAGHCCDVPGVPALQVVEFNVPLSSSNGEIHHPGPEDQYPIDRSSVRFHFFGTLYDWCIFSSFENTNTGLSPLDAQGSSFVLASAVPPADGSTLLVTGYGIDITPPGPDSGYNEDNQTEQSAAGPYVGRSPLGLWYEIDTTFGTSGGPVEHETSGLVYGINVRGSCFPWGGYNTASRIDIPDLVENIACPHLPCQDCNLNGIWDHCDVACDVPCGGCRAPDCGGSVDCNVNGVPDECDIANQTSDDCKPDGVPDECETLRACCPNSQAPCLVTTYECCMDLNGWWFSYATTCPGYDICESIQAPQPEP